MPDAIFDKPIVGLALLLSTAAAPALAQVRPGTPVDRNVGDTGPTAASLRVAQPGLGQFGVGSMLLDRFGDEPYEPTRFDSFAGDPRVSHRFLLQSPGVTALMDRPDYFGPSPVGGWVFNAQTFDGAEILTLTPANIVYVLSPELLQPKPPSEHNDAALHDNPYRVLPQRRHDPNALMQGAQVDRRAYTTPYRIAPSQQVQQDSNYRHPEIIERQRKLREERAAEAEAAAKEQAEAEAASTAPKSKPDSEPDSQDTDQPQPSSESKQTESNHEDTKARK